MPLNSTPPTFDQTTISSFPALAAQLRQVQLWSNSPRTEEVERLVQAYTIHPYEQAKSEAEAALHVVRHILERLRRLGTAFGEWSTFDASAYFDLTHAQQARYLFFEERVSTVHFIFFVDLLLPSFQNTLNFFQQQFAPGYQRRLQDVEMAEHFQHQLQPNMVEQWLRLQRIMVLMRSELTDDISFLAMNGAEEERWRYRQAWTLPPPSGLDERLTPPLQRIPTLTLSHEFPLPAYRQPGRRRRMWYARERNRYLKKRRRGEE
ncbi:MAG: hypothetical protein U0175_09160 [Caldilineaceae bacterium]